MSRSVSSQPSGASSPGARVVFRSAPVLRTAISLSILLVASAVFGWFMLDARIRVQFTGIQLATLIFFVLFMVGMMLSIGLSVIVADDRGLTVRNCVVTKTHGWDEVRGVSFSSGDAWPYLILGESERHPEGDNRMMLGIQRVEGEAADRRVAELRALIAARKAA